MMNGKFNLYEQVAQSIISWYPFKKNAAILVITRSENLYLYNFFATREFSVSLINQQDLLTDEFKKNNNRKFDYIIAIGIIENQKDPISFLEICKYIKKDDGILLLGTENRLALKFFLGDKDPYSFRCFDGIENYRFIDSDSRKRMNGRCYSKFELLSFFEKAGLSNVFSYSVLPSLYKAKLIYAEDYLPEEDLSLRINSDYYVSRNVFLKQEKLYSDIIKSGMFHQTADAYLFECSDNADIEFGQIIQVSNSANRLPENACINIMYRNGTFEKKGLFEEYKQRCLALDFNHKYLKERNIQVLNVKIKNNSILMPCIHAELANVALCRLALEDTEKFISKMDDFRNIILKSSEIESINDAHGPIAKFGFLDLVPINAFFIDDDFLFFDQEFVEKNYPLNAIVYRFLTIIYKWDNSIENIIPLGFFMDRYDLWKQEPLWREMADEFTSNLENKCYFDSENQVNDEIILQNRQIVNLNFLENKDTFFNPFIDNGKKIIVYGIGEIAKKFIAMYKNDLNIAFVVSDNEVISDNESLSAGIYGYTVNKSVELGKINADEYRIIICEVFFDIILKKLLDLGFKDVSVFEKDRIYPGRQPLVPALLQQNKNQPQKKYHIGYIAGVFDLYHLGHLNMFRRAKEQCDYLIVGVTSDRYVIESKKREPFIPFEERLEIVRSCKYVDEAHEIPFEYSGTVEAFQKYHFDVQFSGSDYVNHPWWLEQQAYLRSHGSDLVFFPYTQQTSSTKIKSLIEKGLL